MHSLETVLAYHERSKHAPGRYAASLGYMDWATQPDPFRRFAGAAAVPLPLTASSVQALYSALFGGTAVPPSALNLNTIAAFLELSLGLSAWKVAGTSRWALRNNPSSGNLHPTEGYIICSAMPAITGGVYHYAPREHALEQRFVGHLPLPEGTFLLGLSSIHWREAWKYGERAYRYCQHDIGHALAAARFAAAALGWSARLMDAASDEDVSTILGLNRAGDFEGAESEHPDLLLAVSTRGFEPLDIDRLVEAVANGLWSGTANRLSDGHHPWPVIDEVAEAATKPRTMGTPHRVLLPPEPFEANGLAVDVIRRRRSAQAFDPRFTLPTDAFFAIVDRMAARDAAPFDALPWSPLIHPVLAVHRVKDVSPGLYLAVRDPVALPRWQETLPPETLWSLKYDAPGIALYLLAEGNYADLFRFISCRQDIAAHGAFTLGMPADFDGVLRERGAWWYRRLFWEAGALGQALYLEAEAQGVRGTGIGCYLDDTFHGLLGLNGNQFQSLYHFTVGFPVEDERLQTEPPYAHLERERGVIL